MEGAGRLYMQILGPFRLTAGGRELLLPAAVQRLLALLALRGHVSRARVVGALWPDHDELRALAALRTTVWRLHAYGGAGVEPVLARTTTGLRLGDTVDVDLVELRRTMRSDPEELLPADVAGLCAADAELLPDWDDEWLVLERERVHQMRLHLLERLATALAQRGEFGTALDTALTCVTIDPLRESAHRLVIGIHRAEGNEVEARRAYDRCRRVLWDQLGVAPTGQTRALAEGLPRQRLPRVSPAPLP